MANANWKAELQERVQRLEGYVGEALLGEGGSLSNQVRALSADLNNMQGHMTESDQATAGKLNGLSEEMGRLTTLGERLEAAFNRIDGEIILIKRAVLQTCGTESTVVQQKTRIPEPKAYGGDRSAKELENFLWDMEQYFKTAHIREAEMVDITSMYLTGDAKLWWRTRVGDETRAAVTTWADLKKELKGQFLPANSSWQAREALRRLKHDGTVREYVKNFTSLLLDIKGMSEEDKVFNFIAGLQPWAQAELRRQGVKDFQSAVTAADSLVDMRLDKADQDGNKSKKADKGRAAGNLGEGLDKGRQVADGGQKNKGQSKVGGCFICTGPHFARDCPNKAKLTALVADEDHGGSDSGAEAGLNVVRMGCMQVQGPACNTK